MRKRIENGNDHCILLVERPYKRLLCDYVASLIELEIFEVNDIAVAEGISHHRRSHGGVVNRSC
jgi:hypothetical protein